jgi:hypothetical protein
MLMALLRGKLSREQQNMEDILVSNVFGLLKYLPPEEGLLPFLRNCVDPEGRPLPGLDQPGISVVLENRKFWPWHSEPGCLGCEPDVEFMLCWPDGRKVLVFVEAKYHAGKSSEDDENDAPAKAQPEAPYDQLAREWDNLVIAARNAGAEPALIYLTTHWALPRQDIDESRRAYERQRKSNRPLACYWLSWRVLSRPRGETEPEILRDLR